jgi:proton-coupled amino acid transporter
MPTVVFPVQEGMAAPLAIKAPLKLALFTVFGIYILLGVFCVLLFFDDPSQIQQIIILNLPPGTKLSTGVKILNSFVAIFSYPLVMFPVSQLVNAQIEHFLRKNKKSAIIGADVEEKEYGSAGASAGSSAATATQQKEGKGACGEYVRSIIVRTCLVAVTTVIAVAAPWFGSIVALIGCFTVSLLSFILPPMFHLKLVPGLSTVVKITDYVLIVLGVIVCIFTTVVTLQKIV